MGRASLPMYDYPELREYTDQWWQGLCRHFKDAGLRFFPEELERPKNLYPHWMDPTLFFSQTCGYPLTHALRRQLHIVGAPCYSASGCRGVRYTSFVVVAAENPARNLAELRDTRCAYNSLDSQSGYNALRAIVAPLAHRGRFFGKALKSGGHRESLWMVGNGEADICAVDCVTYALLQRHIPETLHNTRILTETPTAPGMPFITASVLTLEPMRMAVQNAFADPELEPLRAELLLGGFETLPREHYKEIVNMEKFAIQRGYRELP